MAARIPFTARICIIGAGPAGLTHAYYLRKAGYENVDLLEINSQVGGKSHTITYNNRSFDMGANYLTPDYTHIMEMAKEVGAKLYHESSPIAFNPETGKLSALFKKVLEGTNLFAFIYSSIRYFFIRWGLNSVLPVAGNMGLSSRPDLMVSFEEWLDNNKLQNLKRLFSIPTTMMGYGELKEIPAPYVLRYIGLGTFRTMLIFGAGLSLFYPKRFVDGFQRFWERLSWSLNVTTSVVVKEIKRENNKVYIKYDHYKMKDVGQKVDSYNAVYDYLVLSCPLTVQTLEPFLDITENERKMFSPEKVKNRTFGITLVEDESKSLQKYRVFHIFPLAKINDPSIFAHQFPTNPAYEIYTPMTNIKDYNNPKEMEDKIKHIESKSREIISALGGVMGEVLHYDIWKYFYHVELDEFKAGYYDQLEAMQGKNNTFYNMGLNSFELIEPISRYSEYLVSEYYLGNKS